MDPKTAIKISINGVAAPYTFDYSIDPTYISVEFRIQTKLYDNTSCLYETKICEFVLTIAAVYNNNIGSIVSKSLVITKYQLDLQEVNLVQDLVEGLLSLNLYLNSPDVKTEWELLSKVEVQNFVLPVYPFREEINTQDKHEKCSVFHALTIQLKKSGVSVQDSIGPEKIHFRHPYFYRLFRKSF